MNAGPDQNTHSNTKAYTVVGLMFAMFVLPYTYVLYVYNSGELPTAGTNERGAFFKPFLSLNEEPLKALDGSAWDNEVLGEQWVLMNFADQNCEQDCLERIFNTQQAIASLTRNKGKVDQLVVIRNTEPLSEDLQTIVNLKDYSHAAFNDTLFTKTAEQMKIQGSLSQHLAIVAPDRSTLLLFTPEQSLQDVLRDLKRLLKASVSGYSS